MLRGPTPEKLRFDARMRLLNRLVLGGLVLFVPLYLLVRLSGGSSQKLQELPDLLDRIKTPIVWSVPADGVRYRRYFLGPAEEGRKFVLVRVRLEARIRIGFPVVPRCFRLVDDRNTRYHPLSHSPLFVRYSDEISMDRGTVVEGDLLFEIPAERSSANLLFDRFSE